MIYTILFIIFIFIFILPIFGLLFLTILRIFKKIHNLQVEITLEGFLFLCFYAVFFFCCTLIATNDINKANEIKSKIILMKPIDTYREEIAIHEKELRKVERLIERAFDKNEPNISVKMENGVKIYSFMSSSDLGSAELGNAEKQKLLATYIEKQNEIADELIRVNKIAYGEEYYKLQQEYAVHVNNLFSGWLVKWFSIKEDYLPIQNKIYKPITKTNK